MRKLNMNRFEIAFFSCFTFIVLGTGGLCAYAYHLDHPSLPPGVVAPTCPEGASLRVMRLDLRSDEVRAKDPGSSRLEVYCSTPEGFGLGPQRRYDEKTGRLLYLAEYDEKGNPIGDEIFYEKTLHEEAFYPGACGGVRVKYQGNGYARFETPCVN